MDKRIRLTKSKLKKTLLDLLCRMNMEDVTISTLCREAGVNRNTFYSHYSSVDEIFKEVLSEFTQSISESLTESLEKGIITGLEDLLLNILSLIEKNRSMCILIFSDTSKSFLKNVLSALLPYTKSVWQEQLPLNSEYAQIVYTYISGGAISVIEEWVKSNFAIKKEEVALVLEKIILNGQKAFINA
ncbi:MAG TPA: TetR/AcrR family transcriptional regulator [Candidatus Ornithospirochaeta avicola]|uniref:TetR/AcrR family transcriptional regulator n=1 Tax=Candidatus Ornithospirochaeta avicola TaxID=2840896 RepID=A0A9D1TM67_9SPIO|nr:TetR/AcrR family transcriptional regulator [Candidatus Ornithospirochaeta avicola]